MNVTDEMVTAWKLAFRKAYDASTNEETYDDWVRIGLEAALSTVEKVETPVKEKTK